MVRCLHMRSPDKRCITDKKANSKFVKDTVLETLTFWKTAQKKKKETMKTDTLESVKLYKMPLNVSGLVTITLKIRRIRK